MLLGDDSLVRSENQFRLVDVDMERTKDEDQAREGSEG